MIEPIRSVLQRLAPDRTHRQPDFGNYEAVLDAISSEANKIASRRSGNGMIVLQGPSFSIYGPSYVLDRLLCDALRLRRVRVVPVYCDGLQSIECNCFGGLWGGGKSFADNCQFCVRRSRQLWHPNPEPAIRLSEYLTETTHFTAVDRAASIGDDTWMEYEEDGMPLGRWAKDILVNNWLVGDFRLVPECERLGRAHLRNLILLSTAYRHVLETVQPDRVVANDSYYGMWAILAELCRRKGIPFYAHWPVSQTRVVFAANDAPMNLNFRAAWPTFSSLPLVEEQRAKVDAWLNQLSGARELMINTASILAHQNVSFDLEQMDHSKPTALLPANVIWDLAALNKQIIFADMIDWIVQTISWFRVHPQFQLIIKAHPAEQNPKIPETRERVEIALRDRGITLPSNVFLLVPKVRLTVYDLMPLARVGLVHTTSVGFEMAARGLLVLTTGQAPYRGFGFTIDPTNADEYFFLLERSLSGEAKIDLVQQVDLAYKFILFYQFHYYTRLGLFESEWGKPPVINIASAEELLPGRNPHLDYVVDSILQGLPIVSETRWPPMS